MVARIGRAHPKMKIIITGDGLYSKQPFIDELKNKDGKVTYKNIWVTDIFINKSNIKELVRGGVPGGSERLHVLKTAVWGIGL
jgi:hypothetical protein